MRAYVALFVVVGCAGDSTDLGPGDTDTATEPTDTDVPGPVRSDEGSFVVLSWLPSAVAAAPETVILGMFAENRRGILNLAQCVGSAASFCVTDLPENPGDSVPVESLDPSLLGELNTRDVGETVSLGDWTAEYRFDSATDAGFYFGAENNVDLPGRKLGLTLGGEWGPYAGTDDISAPTPMVLTSHDPMVQNEFFDAEPIPLRWEPGTKGEVYLEASTPLEQRLYKLDDDGEYDLDLSALGLAADDDVTLLLGRWSIETVDHDGHEVNVQIQSNQRLVGTWRTIGSRSELDPYDECADARGAPSAVTGNYFGSIQGYTRDLNPGNNGCTGYAASGVDGIVPIDLQPEDLLTVTYQLTANDASLYLLTDCAEVGTCLVGEDATGQSGLEQVVWFNDTGNPIRVYAILDAFDEVNDIFNLDITIDSLGGDVLVPTCVDALDQGPAVTGSYHGTVAGNADLLDPDCAAPASGGEGMTQVYLEPGQRLTVTATVPQGDPKLYLLYNCSIADSCFLAEDAAANGTETLVYDNATGFSEFLYVVLDSELNLGEYFLDITIQ